MAQTAQATEENKITQENQITQETLIGDIVENHPEVVETLLSYGVQCVGCHVSPYEPLGDGFRGHGMSDEQIQEAVQKLNEVIAQSTNTLNGTDSPANGTDLHGMTPTNGADKPTMALTDKAAQKIKELCTSQKMEGLRIAVQPGGCSGYSYIFDLVTKPKKGDLMLTHNQARMFIDKPSLDKLGGATVDYNDGLTGAGFTITNPQAASTCGCGSSFS